MATILFFGRFSDVSDPLEIELPSEVTDKKSLSAFLSGEIEGFAILAAKPDTRISVNMMVSMNEVAVSNDDEIAYMSALSGG